MGREEKGAEAAPCCGAARQRPLLAAGGTAGRGAGAGAMRERSMLDPEGPRRTGDRGSCCQAGGLGAAFPAAVHARLRHSRTNPRGVGPTWGHMVVPKPVVFPGCGSSEHRPYLHLPSHHILQPFSISTRDAIHLCQTKTPRNSALELAAPFLPQSCSCPIPALKLLLPCSQQAGLAWTGEMGQHPKLPEHPTPEFKKTSWLSVACAALRQTLTGP